jgi:hypothetical protein
MKMRVRGNSIRLRLTQSEVQRFAATGRVEETICFGVEPENCLIYALQSSIATETTNAKFQANQIVVFVPEALGQRWADTDEIGLHAEQNLGGGKRLRLLIEKDFACAERREGEDDSDAFPHPPENTVC